MAQWEITHLPMQDTQVQSPGGEDPLKEGRAAHPSILSWENPMDRGALRATVHGVTKTWTRLSNQIIAATRWLSRYQVVQLVFSAWHPGAASLGKTSTDSFSRRVVFGTVTRLRTRLGPCRGLSRSEQLSWEPL